MGPDELVTEGQLQQLVRKGRHITASAVALVCMIGVTALADILVGGPHPDRPFTLGFQLAYAVYASVFATLLVWRILVAAQVSVQRGHARSLLQVLGVTDGLENQRVAIVVPAFPMDSLDLTAHARESTDDVIYDRTRLHPSRTLSKVPSEIGRDAFARRDILLVNDIVRLTSAAGLPTPVIVSDLDFCDAFQRAAHDKARVHLDRYATDRECTQPITGAILVGLWSNVMTCMLSDDERIPFRLVDVGDRRQLGLRPSRMVDEELSPSVPVPAEHGEETRCYGLFARLHLHDFTFVVLGGIGSLGTTRLGDLISRAPSACNDLRNVSESDDIWAAVSCPGEAEAHRDDPFDMLHHVHVSNCVRALKLSSLVEQIDLTSGEQRESHAQPASL